MPTLIAMVGLPRSGKSTIARIVSKELGAPIVSRDCMRLAIHGQRYAKEAEPLLKSLDIYFIRSLFLAGHEVVICDETNFSPEARDHMRDPSWKTAFWEVLTEPKVCKERAMATNQADLVPIIDEMWARSKALECCDLKFFKEMENHYVFTSCVEQVALQINR